MSEFSVVDPAPVPLEDQPLAPVWTRKGALVTFGLFIVFLATASAIQFAVLVSANGGREAYAAAQAAGEVELPFALTVAALVGNAAAGMASVLIGLRIQNSRLRDLGLGAPPQWWLLAAVIITLPLLIVRGMVGLAIMQIVPGAQQDAEMIGELLTNSESLGTMAFGFALAGILAPIWEEIFFRGFLYRWFRNRMGLWPAALLSSLLFGIFHLNVVQGVSVFIMGLALAWGYEKSKSLWVPITMHMATNVVALGLVYVALLLMENLPQ